jgi:ABC-2 type transport system permease protein
MFGHIFRNRLKCIVRDKSLVFWTFVYPFILALFFSMAFSNLYSNDEFQRFPIAVVDNAEYRSETAFQTALEAVSGEGGEDETRLFEVTLSTKDEAADMLEEGTVKGYILFNGGVHVVVRNSGIQQTILKSFVDHYLQVASAYRTIIASDPERAQSIIYDGQKEFLRNISPNDKPANSIVVNYYALISMAVLFGGFFGQKEVDDIQANLSARGARMNLAPIPKMKSFAYSMSAALLIQFLSLAVLTMFLSLVLQVDFGGQIGYILLVCFVGSTTGISYGAFIGTLFKGGKGTAVLIAVSMLLSSAAGLQNANLKYLITSHVPLLGYLNPANLIADAFYSLYYYTGYTRFYLSIGLLCAFTALFFTVVVLVTRRQKYASL